MAGELILRTNKVVNQTTGTNQLQVDDSGGIFSNYGAAGNVVYRLPALCPVGLEFTFCLQESEYIEILTPASGSLLYYDDSTGNHLNGLRATTEGHTCTIVCLDGTSGAEVFMVTSVIGSTWTTAFE